MSSRKNFIIQLAILICFLFICCFMISVHENWRDEIQAWLLAKELSPIELIGQMKYEGHPCLWHFILMPFAKTGFPYVSMNIISTFLVSAGVAVLLWKSPMNIVFKVIAIFGSALWYEYAVISRSYCLIPLFLFSLAYIYPNRDTKPFLYGFFLALLIQTHIIMIPAAGFMSVFFMLEAFCMYKKERNTASLLKKGGGLCLPLLSLIFFLVQVSGASQSSAFAPKTYGVFDYIYECGKAFVGYWGASTLDVFCCFLCLVCVLLVCIAAIIAKDTEAIKAFAIVLLTYFFQISFIVFFYDYNRQRYYTWLLLWIWLIWVLWQSKNRKHYFYLITAVFLLLSLPSYRAISDVSRDIYMNFSGGKECALYINENIPKDAVILQSNTARFTSMVPYLDEEYRIFSTVSGEVETYAEWKEQEPVISTIDGAKEWVSKHYPEASEFWIISTLYSGTTIPPSELYKETFEDGTCTIVFHNIHTCLKDDEFMVYRVVTE